MQSLTPEISDLDVLYTFDASAAASAVAYTGAAAKAYDPAVRTKFSDLAVASLNAQKQARDLIFKLGGAI